MIVVLLVVIVILLLYVGRVAEQAKAKVDAVTALLRRQAEQGSKERQRGLDYEWGHEEWPKWSDDAPEDRAWVPYTNPHPYTSQDAYSVALLKSETVASADARETKRFLRRAYQTLGAYLPDAVCDAIINDTDASVRAWAASHLALVRKDYSQLDRSAPDFFQAMKSVPVTRDYQAVLRNDHDSFVRAALLSNRDNSERFFGLGGVAQGWKEELKSLSPLERLALMRNPDLPVSLPLSMMKESPTELGIGEGEYSELVSVAVLSPNLIERSRRQGRDGYLIWGDYSPRMEEFGEMWELAATTWLQRNPVPYRIFAFIQTKASVKLDIYLRLSGKENEEFRKAIITGCEPGQDRELLKLALNDERDSIKEAAAKRCGDYLPYVRKFRSKNSSAAAKREGGNSESAKTVTSMG